MILHSSFHFEQMIYFPLRHIGQIGRIFCLSHGRWLLKVSYLVGMLITYIFITWKYHTYGEINIDLPCILKTFYQAYELDYFCFSKNLQMSREERFEYVLLTTFLKEYVLNVTSEGHFSKIMSWKETWILFHCFLQKRWNLYYRTKSFAV